MSAIPSDIPDIGSSGLRLRQNPRFDPGEHAIASEDYFVWSRVDGATSVRELILMTGFPSDQAIAVLRKLRALGALLLPGESAPPSPAPTPRAATPAPMRAGTPAPVRAGTPPPVRPGTPSPVRAPTAPPTPPLPRAATPAPVRAGTPPPVRAGTAPFAGAPPTPGAATGPVPGAPIGVRRSRPIVAPATDGSADGPHLDLDPASLDAAEAITLAEPLEIETADRLRILAMRRHLLGACDHFAVLGITRETAKRDIKRVYFRLSKEFHPDRHYGKRIGAYQPWLTEIFQAVTQAFEVLSDDRSRQRYESELVGTRASGSAPAQTPVEYAAALFERACAEEVAGRVAAALPLFAAAIKVDPQGRYYRRAATAALGAQKLPEAEEYARKAAELEHGDPSVARTLARVYKAVGKLRDAEATLLHAGALRTESDVLAREIAADLADVRRLLAAGDL